MAVIAASPRGLTKIAPISSLVTRPVKTTMFDKRLQQNNIALIIILPVSPDAPTDATQDVGSQILHPYPRQYQKSSIVDDLHQLLLSGLVIPTNVLIASRYLEGCTAKANGG